MLLQESFFKNLLSMLNVSKDEGDFVCLFSLLRREKQVFVLELELVLDSSYFPY
jgi:hypothetical protein